MKINLGDKVCDTVTGFEGIAIAKHSYLHSCTRISVQPVVDKDGRVPDVVTFDEPQLNVISPKHVAIGSQDTGGPEKYMPPPRITG